MPEIGFSCATCRYYTASDDKGGICRRYPPQVMIVPGQIVGQLQPANLFPAVRGAEWCGEHHLANVSLSMPVDSRLADEAKGEA